MCCANDSLNARMLKTTRAREATCQPWTELKPVTALLPVSRPSSAIMQRALPKFSANYDLWRRSSCERRCRKQPGTVSMITSYIFAMHDRFRRRDRSMDWSIRFAGRGINEVQKAGWALESRWKEAFKGDNTYRCQSTCCFGDEVIQYIRSVLLWINTKNIQLNKTWHVLYLSRVLEQVRPTPV
jgi:hypothetical protein